MGSKGHFLPENPWRGAAAYEAARRASVWRANTPAQFPAAIMPAENSEDVIAAVRLARERGLMITVRSGGHGWSASHLRDDVLLNDVSRLEQISIDSSGERAWVGPGAKGWHLNRE